MDNTFFEDIRDLLILQGFVKVGITDVGEISGGAQESFESWVESDKNGTMKFFKNPDYIETYKDLRFKHGFAKSVVVAAYPYNTFSDSGKIFRFENVFSVSRYALNVDYHKFLRPKIEKVVWQVRMKYPEADFAVQIDSGAIPEVYWAERAGIGIRRKNGLLYVPEYGSYVFLGLIISSIRANSTTSQIKNDDFCSKCNKCVEACPTQALKGDFTIDARKCLSYLTIEHKGEFLPETNLHGWIYGCDICQQVCPFNQKVLVTHDKNFKPAEFWREITIEKLHNMSNSSFRKKFANSPLLRTGKKRLLRNIDANS